MLRLMGLSDLGGNELFLLVLIAVCTSFAIGWAMDLIMRHVGFGIFGNTIVSLLGIGCGLAGYQHLYRSFDVKNLPMVIMFIVVVIMVLLIVLSWLRRVLRL